MGRAAQTSTALVDLRLLASDGGINPSGVASMRFRNDDQVWGEWQTFAIDSSWYLYSESGERTVYAQFRDVAGNVSQEIISDTITLDAATGVGKQWRLYD